ncbi:MAG: periplasmic heavy metal sensor [Bacteroidota bacterium]|nr:periplasmic heavy metal sensor [Bacteroidota bacterium]
MNRIILLIMLATSIVIAQPQWNDDDSPPFRGKGAICEKLDLSADQQKQFDKMQSDMQKKKIDIRSKIQTLRIDIKDLFKEDNPDKGKIESKMNEVTKLQGEMKKNHLDFWFGVNKILKTDQQKIWKEHRMMFGQGKGFDRPRGTMKKGHGMRGMMRGDCGMRP